MSTLHISRHAVSQATPHIHAALENLLRSWDELNKAEKIVGFDINIEDLSNLAAGLKQPENVRDVVARRVVKNWLAEIISEIE